MSGFVEGLVESRHPLSESPVHMNTALCPGLGVSAPSKPTHGPRRRLWLLLHARTLRVAQDPDWDPFHLAMPSLRQGLWMVVLLPFTQVHVGTACSRRQSCKPHTQALCLHSRAKSW